MEMNDINNVAPNVSGSEMRNLETEASSSSSSHIGQLFDGVSDPPNELTTLLGKTEGTVEQCQQNRVINGVWTITQEEKDARTFILEYDITKVGRNRSNIIKMTDIPIQLCNCAF